LIDWLDTSHIYLSSSGFSLTYILDLRPLSTLFCLVLIRVLGRLLAEDQVFMSQQRQNKILVGANNADTTYTKIFVGGLAWQSQRDSLQRYFEQFGEILEAVVILDKNTGRSKGYGFVRTPSTFFLYKY